MNKTARLQRDSKLWRNLFMLISLALFTAIFIYGPTILLDKQGNDAEAILNLAAKGRIENVGVGYYYTSLVATFLSGGTQRALVFLLGSLFIYRLFRDLRSPVYASMALALSVAPIFMFLTIFAKDTTMPLLTLIVLHIFQGKYSIHLRVALVTIIYLIFGAFFRQYYLLIALTFFALYFLSRARMRWLLFYTPIFGIILLLIPSDIFPELQGARDLINKGNDSVRSAFFNYVPPTDLASFIINYAYAAARLNLAPLFSFSMKEIFLFANNVIFLALIYFGVKNSNEKIRYPAFLFLSHILVLIIFEPDLGSYLRHSSSVLLYLVPVMVSLDQRLLLRLLPSRQPSLQRVGSDMRKRRPRPIRT